MAQVIRGYHGDTLICDSYAATRILPPDRPEPPRPDPREDRISHDELLRAEGWTDDDLSRAQRYAFPRAIGRRRTGLWGSTAIYSKKEIARWRQDFVALASKVK